MSEQKRTIKYSGLEYRPSQASIQTSGGASIPNVPAQYGKVSAKMGSASRNEQIAKALGQVSPALRSLAFALGEGFAESKKNDAIKQQKLEDQQKLLGETLADSGFIFKENVDKDGVLVDGEPIWKVINPTSGEVKDIKSDDDLPDGIKNPLQLTYHNLHAVQKFWKHRQAYHTSEIFNTIAVEEADRFLSETRLKYDYFKKENALPTKEGSVTEENPDGTPIKFETYFSLELGQLRNEIYQRFGRDYHSSINIEKGLGVYRKAYARDYAKGIADGMLRDTATSVGLFINKLPKTGAVPDQWPEYRDSIIGPGSTISTLDKDIMLINALEGRLQNATLETLDRINPEFLFKPNKNGPPLVQVKGLSEKITSYANSWTSKRNQLEEEKRKEVERYTEKTKELEQKSLGGVVSTIRTHIENHDYDLQGNRELISANMPLFVALAKPGEESKILDELLDQARELKKFSDDRQDKTAERIDKLNNERDQLKSNNVTGRIGETISNDLTKITDVDAYHEYASITENIAKIHQDIFTDLGNNVISKEQATMLLGQLGKERTRLYGLWQEASQLKSVADANKKTNEKKENAIRLFDTMLKDPLNLEGNREVLKNNHQLFTDAGFNPFTIYSKLDQINKIAKEENAPATTTTDTEVFTDLLDRIDARDPNDEAEQFLIQDDITRSIASQELTVSDGLRLRGYVRKDPKEYPWTKYEAYKNILERTIGRYNPGKLSPFSATGRAEIYAAYNEARFIFKNQMRKWAESLDSVPTEDQVAEQGEILAEQIHNNDKFIELEERSKVQAGESAELVKKVLEDITNRKIDTEPEDKEVEKVTYSVEDMEASYAERDTNPTEFNKIFAPYLTQLGTNERYNKYKGIPSDQKQAKLAIQNDYIMGRGMFKGLDPNKKESVHKAVLWFMENTP